MPLDPGANVYAPPKKKKPDIEQIRAENAAGVGTPLAPQPYQGSIVPGVYPQGDVHRLNAQVNSIVLAFQNRFGHQPSPGLVFDLLRAPIDPSEYDSLFKSVPKSAMAARAAGPHSIYQAAGPHSQPLGTPKDISDPAVAAYEAQLEQKNPQINQAGVKVPTRDLKILDTAVAQIAQSLVYSPYGVYLAGKAIGSDVKDIATLNPGSATATSDFLVQMAKSVKKDVQHPGENPGYLFLDALGALSLGAGAVARGGAIGRLGAAGRAAEAGADVRTIVDTFGLKPQTAQRLVAGQNARAVISAALRRPLAGVHKIGPEGAEEFRLLSENALLRVPQRWYYDRLQERILSGERTTFDKWTSSILGPEKTIGRAARARARIEGKVLQAPALDLAFASNSSFIEARIMQKLPRRLRRRLTVGDEYAIKAVATDHPDAINAWRDWHEKMIEYGIGDPAFHRAQIAGFDLAEQALNDLRAGKNPRLQKALDLAREVSNEQQSMKMTSLGLDAAVAESRVAKVGALLEEMRHTLTKDQAILAIENVVNDAFLTRGLKESYYYPDVAPVGSLAIERVPGSARASGKYGVPAFDAARRHPELTHRFEAKLMMAGDTVVDVNKVVGAAFARTARSVTLLDDWQRLLKLSREKKSDFPEWQRRFLMPVREIKGVPDELKQLLTNVYDGQFLDETDAALLGKEQWQNLHAHLFPPDKDLVGVEGVRWVDSRQFIDLHRYPGEPADVFKVLSAIQDPLRVTTLYGKPSYLLNAVGNVGMLMLQDTFSPVSMAKSLQAKSRYGERNLAWMNEVMGEGKAKSFLPEDYTFRGGSILSKTGRSYHQFAMALAHGWSIVVDRWMRRAALINELEKLGYKTEDDLTRLRENFRTDPHERANLYQAVERGNKSMVQFDNLTPFEKSTMRHIIFVYPWVSRSAVWSIRTMLEHPLKTWTLSELGQIGEEKAAAFFSRDEVKDFAKWISPDWFKETGYMPIARTASGNPVVLNPNSVNSFSTMQELYQQASSLGPDGDPFTQFLDMAGPGVQLGTHLITGRNNYGDTYSRGRVLGPLLEQLGGLPQVRAAQGAGKTIKPLDGVMNQYGPLITGGLWPKQAVPAALGESYYKENPEASKQRTRDRQAADRLAKAREQTKLIHQAEQLTGKILNEPVPADVKDAVNLAGRFTMAYVKFANLNGHNPGSGDSKLIQIGQLEQMGRITPAEASDLRASLSKALGPKGDLTQWSADFGDKYLHRQEMYDWHHRRNVVLDIANNLGDNLDYLRKSGLWSGSIGTISSPTRQELQTVGQSLNLEGSAVAKGIFTKAALGLSSPQIEVARKYLEYEDKLNAQGPSSSSETVSASQLRAWQDAHDKPISVNGVKYPSPQALKWASYVLQGTLNDPDFEQKALASRASQSWDTLSDFEKRLLGVKVAPGTSEGWVVYNTIAEAMRGNITARDVSDPKIRAALPLQTTGSLSQQDRYKLAKYVSRYFSKGFYRDFLMSEAPNYQRYQVLPSFTKSQNSNTWKQIFGIANQAWRARQSAPNKTVFDSEWKAYVTDSLIPWAKQQQGFSKELDLYGENFLASLIS